MRDSKDRLESKLKRRLLRFNGKWRNWNVKLSNYSKNRIITITSFITSAYKVPKEIVDIDIDKAFGQCVFGSDKFGGLGYSHSEKENHSDPQSLNPISSSELIFVKRRDEVQEREGNGEGWEWQPNIGRGHEG